MIVVAVGLINRMGGMVVMGRRVVVIVTVSLRSGVVVMRVPGMAVVVMMVPGGLRSRMGRMVVMAVRGRGVVVVPMPVGVRRRMRGGVVMAVRTGCGGLVIMAVAMVVVRLVLVAHLDSVPQPLFRGHCGEIGIT